MSEEILDGVKVYDTCRNGHQRRVKAVKHASMAGKDIARILYAYRALEERLYKVAPCAEEDDCQTHTHPLQDRILHRLSFTDSMIAYDCRHYEDKDPSADAAFP